MKIISLNTNYINRSFCANNSEFDLQAKRPAVYEKGQIKSLKGDGVFNRHITEYCRADMNWLNLGRIIKQKYPDFNDVNFIVYASSTGEEPYSLEILLNKIYGSYVPIKAFDISQSIIDENIKHQKEGVIIELKDARKIFDTLNLDSFSDYFKADKITGDIKLNRKITDSVEFKRSNILEDIDKIDSSKPSVIFARNMWPYVKNSEYKEFCEKLRKKSAPKSMFIIGVYDYNGESYLLNSNSFPNFLSKSGFKPVSRGFLQSFRTFNLIFEKK